jgi:DNA-binding SARP family transcriptional activator
VAVALSSSSPRPTTPSTIAGTAVLGLLGGFELEIDGTPVVVPASAQRLLAFLAFRDRPVGRSYVAGTLWLYSTDDRAARSLRSLLWRLSRIGFPLVECVGPALRLSPGVSIDVHRAVTCARRLLNPSDPWCASPTDVVELGITKEVLPDWYDDWIVIEREAFRQLRSHALEALAGRLTERARFAEAIEVCLYELKAEPLRETAHRALIAAHLGEGNVAEALKQYEVYRTLVGEQLGIEPSQEMEELVDGLTRR